MAIDSKNIYKELTKTLEQKNININYYYKKNLPFIRLLKKIHELEKSFDYNLIVNHFVLSQIFIYERKKIPLNIINKLFFYLLHTINELQFYPKNLRLFVKYYQSLQEKNLVRKPYKRYLKNFKTYIKYLEENFAMPYAFTSYISGFSLGLSNYDASILSKYGMYYSVFLRISWDLQTPDSLLLSLKEYEGLEHLSKLHFIGNELDRYFKIAESVTNDLNKKSLKIFLLYELTDFLGEIYNIITDNF